MKSEDMEQDETGQIHQLTLKGHSGQVLCLDHASSKKSSIKDKTSIHHDHSNLLMSGSEDGTARLWDLRSSYNASLCILSPTDSKEITSVAFSPPQIIKSENPFSNTTSTTFAQNIMV